MGEVPLYSVKIWAAAVLEAAIFSPSRRLWFSTESAGPTQLSSQAMYKKRGFSNDLQGFLAYNETHPPRTLP